MASRAQVLKLLQEIRGFAEITNRRVASGTTNELWVPGRPKVIKAAAPQRRLEIDVNEGTCEPVKIQYSARRSRLPVPSSL